MKVNFGAGQWRKDGWTTVDRGTGKGRGCDIVYDFTSGEPWPFEDNSIELAFCSHVLEHLNDAHGQALLRNIQHSLKPGGALRVIVPDFGYAVVKFRQNDWDWFCDITKEIALEGDTLHDRLASFVCRYGYVHTIDNGFGPESSYEADGPIFSYQEFYSLLSNDNKTCAEIVGWIMAQERPANADLDHQNGFDAPRLIDWLTDAKLSAQFVCNPGLVSKAMSFCMDFVGPEFYNRPKISLVVDAIK